MSHNIFPVVSNIFFLFPSINAFVYGEYIYSVIYALILFTSGSFHACDEGFGCVFPFVIETKMDYIVAILTIPMTAIYLVHWNYVWKHLQDILLVMFVFLVVLIEVQNTSDSFTAPGLIVAGSLAIPLCYWIAYFVYMRWVYVPETAAAAAVSLPKPRFPTWTNWGYFPKYEWGALLASIGLSAVAISLFATQGMFAYSYVPDIHAMWHIFAAFGQYFLMEIKAPKRGSIGYYRATRETWAKIRAMGGLKMLQEQADQIDISKPIDFVIV
jgi:hypothetical protein